MLITVGILNRHADGCLAGVLRTLTIRTQIELRPLAGRTDREKFEVMIGSGFVAGYATWDGDGIDVVVLSPEFSRPVIMRAVPRVLGSDEWQLVWDAANRPAE